eukprot:7388094-Heterocapsa_arctica.AAC.1
MILPILPDVQVAVIEGIGKMSALIFCNHPVALKASGVMFESAAQMKGRPQRSKAEPNWPSRTAFSPSAS